MEYEDHHTILCCYVGRSVVRGRFWSGLPPHDASSYHIPECTGEGRVHGHRHGDVGGHGDQGRHHGDVGGRGDQGGHHGDVGGCGDQGGHHGDVGGCDDQGRHHGDVGGCGDQGRHHGDVGGHIMVM